MHLQSAMDYHAEAMAHEMTMADPTVKVIHKDNMVKVKGMAQPGMAQSKQRVCPTWECRTSANYGGPQRGK